MSKLLTVVGATGAQGGALIAHVLKHPKLTKIYKLRGMTRDVTKPAAIALQEQGVEVVQADMDDQASLKDAVAGSYAVFSVTNFWEKASAASEIAQGKAVADAAVAAGATVIIWSSLPNVTKMTSGKLSNVHHFDSKAEVETYIRGLPIQSIFYMPAWYMQNFKSIMTPQPKGDGTYVFAQPWDTTTQLPLIDIADTGKFLAPALLDPAKYNGKTLVSATAYYNPIEIADGWTKGTGKTVVFEKSSTGPGAHSSLPAPVREALAEVRGLVTEYAYYGPEGKEQLDWMLAQMEEKPRSWEDFVRAEGAWFEDA